MHRVYDIIMYNFWYPGMEETEHIKVDGSSIIFFLSMQWKFIHVDKQTLSSGNSIQCWELQSVVRYAWQKICEITGLFYYDQDIMTEHKIT